MIGNIIASIATPVARALRLPCIDPVTQQLRPESACNKARIGLNEGRYADAFYDRFWSKQTGGKTMPNELQDWIITKQIAVKAVSAEDAMSKINEGVTVAVTVAQRPQPQQPQNPMIRR